MTMGERNFTGAKAEPCEASRYAGISFKAKVGS